jgi:hypothetical protein
MPGPFTDEIERLLAMAAALYEELKASLPADRGHCNETQAIISSLASAARLDHVRCQGYHRLSDGTADVHRWVLVDGSVIHYDHARRRVERADPSKFEPHHEYRISFDRQPQARPGRSRVFPA